ncbi:unnamed protein product [Moneuplotes crassus]|uniref:Uncharacterized protein n=1 Tax=Euplotes crassus TaxID=5936 RepID=A0AAD1Y3V7_EUPCR|nr:unnamed protein product [Moneuplotes crassus]
MKTLNYPFCNAICLCFIILNISLTMATQVDSMDQAHGPLKPLKTYINDSVNGSELVNSKFCPSLVEVIYAILCISWLITIPTAVIFNLIPILKERTESLARGLEIPPTDPFEEP